VIASLEVKCMDYVKLGEKIKRERVHNRLTQEVLAEMAEITSSYVGQIERGERKVTLSKLVRIANVLNVSVDYLLSDTIDMIDDDDNHEPLPEGSIPTLAQFRSFFRFLKRDIASETTKKYNVLSLKRKIEKNEGTEIKISAIVTIIKVLEESELISTDFEKIDAPFEITLKPFSGKKTDIDNSIVLNRIRNKHK
jgi:transcriptional regulator with XRE-family HTH domain